jgi:hypothetical protein
MGRRRCAIRPRPPAGPPRWPRTVRRPPSSHGRCASRRNGTLRQSLDIALADRHEAEVGRAYVNLHASHAADRDWATAERYFTPGIAYCDDRDITTYSIFLRSERTSVLERTGRWDEAVALCRELLRKGGPSPNIRLCPLHRLGTILARRGEPGAWGVPR